MVKSEANVDTFECVLTYDSLNIASSFEIDFDGRTYQTTEKSFTIRNLEANTGYEAKFRAYDVYDTLITEKDIAFTTLNKMITTVKRVKQYMKSTDFLYYEEIASLIEEVEETILQYRNKDFDIEDDVLVYPVGSELVAVELIVSKLLKEKTDKTSESLGDYSISYKGNTVSNENEILKGIKRFGVFS